MEPIEDTYNDWVAAQMLKYKCTSVVHVQYNCKKKASIAASLRWPYVYVIMWTCVLLINRSAIFTWFTNTYGNVESTRCSLHIRDRVLVWVTCARYRTVCVYVHVQSVIACSCTCYWLVRAYTTGELPEYMPMIRTDRVHSSIKHITSIGITSQPLIILNCAVRAIWKVYKISRNEFRGGLTKARVD